MCALLRNPALLTFLFMSPQQAVYNTCANFQWQVCAAKGRLSGQGSPTIRFAHAPKDLDPFRGNHALGSCTGYAPAGCGDFGYASLDIYFLEVCIYNTICSNGAELFDLDAGEDWVCHLHHEGFVQLKTWMLQPNTVRH